MKKNELIEKIAKEAGAPKTCTNPAPFLLGDTVRRARCVKGWSIEQLSKRSGVPGRLLREMEGGSSTYVPSETNTVLLAEALRVPAGPLLEERERRFKRWHRPDAVG